MDNSFTNHLPTLITDFEQQGLVTRTFRRLDPARQLAIIDAIMEESSEHGPAEMNIKKVAARAEVSIGSLYQYFSNKEGLLNFAIALTVQETLSAFNTFIPYLDQLSFMEAYSIYISTGLEWGKQEQQFVRFFAKAAYQNHPELEESIVTPISDCMLHIVRLMVTKGQENGEIHADLDADALARILHALSIAIGDPVLLPYLNKYFQIMDDSGSLEGILTTLMQILQQGILASDPQEDQTK